jgi:methylase of polypeptide subunit release factors
VSLAARFREIGLTREEMRGTSARHAALRDDAAALALRLFRDGLTLTPEECDVVFDGAELPGKLVVNGRAAFQLQVIESLYLFSDWPGDRADEVLPPGETTAILYRAAKPLCHPDARVLDLGCGSGTLALLLASHARACIGTDVNPRALRLARLNANVNGIDNTEFRLGDLYEPLGEERFDLIVSQPPYVPAPPEVSRHIFLHGGERGDELACAVLAGMPAHLHPDGRGLMFSDWALAPGEDLRNRAGASGLQTTLFTSPLLTVESYARSYGEPVGAHFSRAGIEGVRQCLAVCRTGEGFTERTTLPHEWNSLDTVIAVIEQSQSSRSHRRQ